MPVSTLTDSSTGFALGEEMPAQMTAFPRFRYMGSKYRLLEWIHGHLQGLSFESAIDAFSGSGTVSYLLKSMGKSVHGNDSLCFPTVLNQATVANNDDRLSDEEIEFLLGKQKKRKCEKFIQNTFEGIFYTPEELIFLDDLWCGIRQLDSKKAPIAISAILRSAVKRQPRGLFTVAGDPEKYKDGRRDLQLTLKEHFIEQVALYNDAVFDNGRNNSVSFGDVMNVGTGADLVYMDPPYVPKSDDNCYMKRYHFLEGLSCYWEGKEIMENSKVRKITKPFTPFSYRRTAIEAFDALFEHFADSTLVLSYSSNGFPDLETLTRLMKQYKSTVQVHEKEHRYHFGNHATVKRNVVQEYLIVGSS